MNPRNQHWALLLVVILALGSGVIVSQPRAAGSDSAKDSDKPKSSAEKIAGRWRITLQGLPNEHKAILASLAVEGEILMGTLTIGRKTVPVSSGQVADTHFKLEFRHIGGERFKMRGRASDRGLEGHWEALDLKGKWFARRLNQ